MEDSQIGGAQTFMPFVVLKTHTLAEKAQNYTLSQLS